MENDMGTVWGNNRIEIVSALLLYILPHISFFSLSFTSLTQNIVVHVVAVLLQAIYGKKANITCTPKGVKRT